jgi:putative nucleotidyltransferase with HDIG domain
MFPAHIMLEGIETLPLFPGALNRLSDIVNSTNGSVYDFEQAALLDPVFTARLLHSINTLSPLNTSVKEAAEEFGLQRLFDAAVGTTIRRPFPLRIHGYGITAQKFWVHCIAVATIAEFLARRVGFKDAHMAFTAGLLHDIGQFVIANFLTQVMPTATWWTFDTPDKERSLLGCNHCDVGYEVAVKWNLPETIRDCCRWHHEPNKATDDLDSEMLTIINAADELAYMIGFPGVGYAADVLDKDTPARLGFGTNELYELAETVKQVIAKSAIAAGIVIAKETGTASGYSSTTY